MADLTVVYYSASTEPPAFERRVRSRLAAAADGLPIVSVTQTPAWPIGDRRIAVGRQFACDMNAHRQILLGARAARTDWVACAEADALYPPAYFRFDPPQGRRQGECYRYVNVWILGRCGGFRRKEWTEGAQVVWRDTLIAALEATLDGLPEWCRAEDDPPSAKYRPIFRKRSWQVWEDEWQPVVSCKTGFGLRAATSTVRGAEPADAIPWWGRADDLRAALFRFDEEE